MSEQQIDPMRAFIKNTLMVTIRGMVSVMPAATPDQSLLAICRGMADVIGSSFAGTDDGVRKFREQCRVEFSAALHQAAVIPLPDAPAAKPQAEEVKPVEETFGAKSEASTEEA